MVEVALEELFRKIIVERYERNPVEEANLAYHNLSHTDKVVARSAAIAGVLKNHGLIADREVDLIRIAALGHDLVQEYEMTSLLTSENEAGCGRRRLRKTGSNEMKSAEETLRLSRASLGLSGSEELLVADAITATAPQWSHEYATVVPAGLTPDASLITLAVTLADLADPGMETDTGYIEAGKHLFAEEFIINPPHTISGPAEEFCKEIMRDSAHADWQYAVGRRMLTALELSESTKLSLQAKKDILALFTEFSRNIQLSLENSKKCKEMNFADLCVWYSVERNP